MQHCSFQDHFQRFFNIFPQVVLCNRILHFNRLENQWVFFKQNLLWDDCMPNHISHIVAWLFAFVELQTFSGMQPFTLFNHIPFVRPVPLRLNISLLSLKIGFHPVLSKLTQRFDRNLYGYQQMERFCNNHFKKPKLS